MRAAAFSVHNVDFADSAANRKAASGRVIGIAPRVPAVRAESDAAVQHPITRGSGIPQRSTVCGSIGEILDLDPNVT